MMKEFTFKLTLEEGDDENEIKTYISAPDMKYAVHEFDQWLRNKVKHDCKTDEECTIYDEVRDKLRFYLSDRDLSLD